MAETAREAIDRAARVVTDQIADDAGLRPVDRIRERIARVLIEDHEEQGFTAGLVEVGECYRLADLIARDLEAVWP